MPQQYDATTKFLIERHPEGWLEFLRLGNDPVQLVDADIATVAGSADKVIKVLARRRWLLHLELQSGPDASLPLRTVRSNVLLNARHQIPVRSVVVLLHPRAKLSEISGKFQRQWVDGTLYLDFHYDVVELWRVPVTTLLAGPLALLPLATLADFGGMPARTVVNAAKRRVVSEAPPEERTDMLMSMRLLMGLKFSQTEVRSLFGSIKTMKESSTYQELVGMGRREGRAEGRVEGKQEYAVHALILLASERFGAPSAEQRKVLDAIQDLATFDAMLRNHKEASSWNDLLAMSKSTVRKGSATRTRKKKSK